MVKLSFIAHYNNIMEFLELIDVFLLRYFIYVTTYLFSAYKFIPVTS